MEARLFNYSAKLCGLGIMMCMGFASDLHRIRIGFASDLPPVRRICVLSDVFSLGKTTKLTGFISPHFHLLFYNEAASECVAQGVVLYRAPNAPWLLLFASSCEGKGNNECKSHAPMGHRSEDEVEFRMQRCHAGQRSATAARSCLRQDGELCPATGMGKTFTTTRSSLNQAGSGW